MSRLRRLRRLLVIVGGVVVVDALVYGIGMLTGAVAIPSVLVVLIIAGIAVVRRDIERAKLNLLRAGVWIVAAVLASAITGANQAISEWRGAQVIAAVRAYEARHQRLPDRLETVVPDSLSLVPRARYTLIGSEFWYMVGKDQHTLAWFTMGFRQRRYTFETNRWRWRQPLD